MYFNRKNSQQKNWRMIKKGKHFLFGCALVFAIGASANVASAETIVSEATADQTQQVTETSESASSENVTSTTAVSEEATSTTATSEVASEIVASSETASTTSEAASETSTVESSEVASSETSTSATEVVASETSSTTSATSVANRTAYIGYEVQYTTSTGEVVGKTANIVAADTTEAVATATITVAATDVPAGYELAAEQTYSLTQQISENQINILSFAVVKKSEEEEIAASQLENKTPLLQAIAEAEALTSEATRLLATSQQGNLSLAAATEATKVVTTEATTVLKDPSATEEQVQATTATVQESSVSLGEELAKLNAEGIVTAQLSSVTGSAAVTDLYNITWDNQSVPGRTDAGFELKTDANGKRILVYKYNLADTTAFTMDDVLKQLNAIPKDANAGLRTLDGTEKSKLESATDGYGTAGRSAQLNGQTIDFLDIVNPVKLWGGQRVVGAASPAGMDPNYTTLYVPGTTDKGTKSHQTTVGGTNGTSTVTLDGTNTFDFYSNQVDRQKLYIRSVEAAYEGGTGSAIDTDTDTDYIPVYMVGYEDTTRPTVTVDTTSSSQLYASIPVSEYLFVFGTTEGTTETETGATNTAPVVNKANASATFATMSDPEGDALTISYEDNSETPKSMTSLGSNLTLGTDGKIEGSFAHTAGGSYTRRVIATDPSGDKGASAPFYVFGYTDKEVNTTPVEKTSGSVLTETEIFAKLGIATTSTAFPVNGNGQTVPTVPDSEYTRTVVGYRPVGSTTVTDATIATLPTTGEYEVKVRTRNIYGQDIYNWVTVKYLPEFKNPVGDRTTTPTDIYVWKDTPMRIEADLSVVTNGATINEIYFVEDETTTRTGDGLTVSTEGKVSGQTDLEVGTHNVDSIIKYDNSSEVRSGDRFWIAVMDAVKTADVTKNVGDTYDANSLATEVLNNVEVQKGDIPENWGSADAPNADWVTTKTIVDPATGAETTVPTTAGTHEVTVRVTNNQGRYKDVVVNVTIPNTPTTATDKQTIYVFNNTPIQTVDPATKEPNNVNEVKVATLTDPEGIKSVAVTREGESLDYSVDNDGNASGTPSVDLLGYYSSSLTVTDNLDSITEVFANGTSDDRFITHIMDATVADEVTKGVGETPTEAEILAKVNVNTGNSGNIVADPTSMYEKVLAPGQTLPTTPGRHEVTVRVITDSNVYKDVVVVVNIPENPPTTATDKQTIYVFNNTPIQTVDPATKEPNNVNEVKVATLTDPEGIKSVAVTREGESLDYSVDNDGNASGTPSVDLLGYYSSSLTVTDNLDSTTEVFANSTSDDRFITHIMDATVTGEVTKGVGETPTEAEILAQVNVNTGNSGNIVADPTTMYEKVLAPGQTLPTAPGRHEVTVRVITDSNVYKDVTVVVNIPEDKTAPETPTVVANEDGTVTVTPSQTAGDDTKTVDITYTDETGTSQTVTATKADDGTWSVPADSGVTVNPTTGVVTIPADQVKDGSTVSAASTDEVGNTSTPATDYVTATPTTTEVTDPSNLTDDEKAKVKEEVEKANPDLPTGTTVEVGNDGTVTITYPDGSVDTIPATDTVAKDSTAPVAPTVEANTDGSVTVTPAGDDTTTVAITYTDENGVEKTVTATKADDGTWSVPADSGVTVNPTTGVVTIPADQVKDGSTVSAASTDEVGNTSTPATDYVTATPTTTEVTDPSNLTDDEKAKVKEEVEKANPDLPTGTDVTVGDNGTVTITYPDGSTDTIPGTDTVAKDSTAPEAPVVTAKPDGSVTVTPAGDDTTTVEITYTDENGVEKTVTATKAEDGTWSVPADSGVTVDPTTGVVTIPADQVKDSSDVTAVSKDEVGNPSTPSTAETPATTDNVTPATPAVTEVTDPSKLTDAEKAKVKEEVEKSNPNLPTGTDVTVGDNGTVTITYPDGSTDTIPGTDTVAKDSTAPEAPVVTAKPDGSVTVTPAGDDTTTVEITYTDENGVEKTVTATKAEDGTWSVPADSGLTVDSTTGAVTIPADKVKDSSNVTAVSKDEVGNPSTQESATTPATTDNVTPATPAVTEVTDPSKLTDAEKAKVKEEVEKSNPNLPTGTDVTVGDNGTVTITYPDGSTDTIPGTDTVAKDSTAPEAPVVTAKPDGSVTVTPAGDDTTTVEITYTDENGVEKTVTATKADDGTWSVPADSGVTVDPTTGVVTIPADQVEDNSTVSATSTDEVGNPSTPSTAETPATTDNVTPVAPAVTEVTDPSNLTDDEKAKVKEEVEKANPDLPTGTEVTVGNDGTVTITYPDGSVDTIPGTDTVTPITDTTAPEAPVVNAPKEGDTTVTGTTEPGATVTVTFPDGSTVTTTADENGNYTVDVPSGVELKEGDKVTATATDEAGNTSTPTETTTTANPSDADENTPNVPAVTPVEDPNNLTDEEKAKVKEEVEKANPDLPTGTEVTVGNDGTVTVTYPDGSVDTIPGTDTVVSTTPTPQTDAEKNDLTNPTKTPVGDTNNLTEDEKAKVKEEVEKANPDLPTGTEVTVGNDGTVTITYPDGSVDTIPGTDTVVSTTPTPQTDAEKNDLTNPTKTPVGDTNNLTDDEKAKVKEEVEKANPDLPTGTEVAVGNDGTVTVTYPDGSVDTIPGTDTVVSTTPTPQTDAEKNDLTNPTKTPVTDVNNLTDEEKAKVKEEVEKANPDLPTGTTITVGNDGTATITYPDGSTDTLTGTVTVTGTTPTPQTDAEKNDLTNPTKTPVTDVNNLTDDEKAKVKEEVEKANPDLPSGTTITVGNDGTATITYPDGSTDTLTGTVTVIGTAPTPQTDAEKNDLTNPTKTPVADTNNLTEEEKAKVKEEVEKANPDLPTGTTITVGNDGTATITYPDGSTDTLTGTVTVIGTAPTPQTDVEKNDLANPTKTPVADTNNLTDDEKAKVKEEVEKSNPNLPTGTTIEVSNGGSVTIAYPDGTIDIIPGSDAVVPTTPTPQTDAEKNDLTNPTKTPVADTNNLTEDEKAKVKEEVEKANPGLPTGITIVVSNGGSVTITYPDGSIDIIPGADTVVTTTPVPQTDAEKNGITNPTKTPVADTNNLTEEEKAKVKEEVEKSNPGLPSGTTIVVGNGGSVTITYPDGSIDIIPGADTVVTTTPVPQTDAEKNDITNPTKTPVADADNLTEDEKAKVKEEVEKANPGLPSGTTIEVSNGGSVTITYPDGSIDIIPGADTVVTTTPVPQTDAEKNGITNPTKTPVADTNNLTEDEKAKVKEEVEKSNPGLPTGTTIEVSNGGSVTITYPDGSIDIIPATDAVVPTTPTPQTDAEKNGITNPAKTPVADTNNLTEDEKAKVKEEVEKSNPGLPTGTTIVVGNDGSVTITYPDGSVDTISGTDTVTPNTDTTAPEAPIVNTPKAGDKTITGTAEPGSTVTVTFPDGSTVTTTADENGNFTVDVPAGVELQEGDKVTATATDGAGNTSASSEVTVAGGTAPIGNVDSNNAVNNGNSVDVANGASTKNKQAVLPKTGEESGMMSLMGLAGLVAFGLLGFKRRRKEEE